MVVMCSPREARYCANDGETWFGTAAGGVLLLLSLGQNSSDPYERVYLFFRFCIYQKEEKHVEWPLSKMLFLLYRQGLGQHTTRLRHDRAPCHAITAIPPKNKSISIHDSRDCAVDV